MAETERLKIKTLNKKDNSQYLVPVTEPKAVESNDFPEINGVTQKAANLDEFLKSLTGFVNTLNSNIENDIRIGIANAITDLDADTITNLGEDLKTLQDNFNVLTDVWPKDDGMVTKSLQAYFKDFDWMPEGGIYTSYDFDHYPDGTEINWEINDDINTYHVNSKFDDFPQKQEKVATINSNKWELVSVTEPLIVSVSSVFGSHGEGAGYNGHFGVWGWTAVEGSKDVPDDINTVRGLFKKYYNFDFPSRVKNGVADTSLDFFWDGDKLVQHTLTWDNNQDRGMYEWGIAKRLLSVSIAGSEGVGQDLSSVGVDRVRVYCYQDNKNDVRVQVIGGASFAHEYDARIITTFFAERPCFKWRKKGATVNGGE